LSYCKATEQAFTKVFLQKISPAFRIIHAAVRWLNAGKALSRVWGLIEEIKGFIPSNGHYHSFSQLSKDNFKIALAFMVGLFQYFNELNLHLQRYFCISKRVGQILNNMKKNNSCRFPELIRTELRLVRMPPNCGPVSSRSHS
jgi:hypothetical protein